jgi:hypothetical protein
VSSISSIPDAIAVWGDELLEKGDPLGEIIARPGDEKLRTAYEHRHFEVGRPKCVWRHGVIDELRVQTNWGHDAMDEITRCPATRYLRLLEIVLSAHRDFPTTDPIPLLVERGLSSSLRDFFFWPADCHSDLSEIYSRISDVERLDLGEPARLGLMDLPRLKTLRAIRFGPERFAELAHARLPALETLRLFATPWVDFEGLTLPFAPKLSALEIGRPNQLSGYAAREWEALLDSPVAESVRRIHFSGALGAEREEALLAHVPKLARYQEVAMVEPRSKELADALDRRLGDRLLWT